MANLFNQLTYLPDTLTKYTVGGVLFFLVAIVGVVGDLVLSDFFHHSAMASSSRRPPKLDSYIGDDQVSEFKEAFELFDSERTGFITKEGLQTVLKQFGVRVEPAAFTEMFNEADATGNGKIAFPEFLSMMGRRMKQTTSEEILRQAFKTFDPENTGFIPKAVLQDALMNMGDRLKPHEFAEFLGLTENEKGQIRYDNFINTMFTKK